MPELPEVETIKVALEPELVGRTLRQPWAFESAKFTDARQVDGATITDVERRAKFLVMALDDDRELIFHLGMTGKFQLGDAVESPHVRASWHLEDAMFTFVDTRRFGRIRVVPAGDYSSIPTLAAAGPEPFDPSFDGQHLYAATRSSTRRIKTQLLSQRPVAGVGNIYADEALWLAKVNPSLRRITKRQAHDLAEAIVEVLAQGIANGGTTLRDYRTLDGGTGENQFALHAYGRAGKSCDRCEKTLKSKVIDARNTTWCPNCQRR